MSEIEEDEKKDEEALLKLEKFRNKVTRYLRYGEISAMLVILLSILLVENINNVKRFTWSNKKIFA